MPSSDGVHPSVWRVKKIDASAAADGTVDNSVWNSCPSLQIGNSNHWAMDFEPDTSAKICYDENSIHILFKVRDNFIRCLASELNGEVWKDACVEFFFAPEGSRPTSYYNLEVNCGGAVRLGHQSAPNTDIVLVRKEDGDRIRVVHSLAPVIKEEIKEPTLWTLEIAIPFEILKNYSRVFVPHPGSKWKANFYKCAENNSHPHWLSWAPITSPAPNFHLPQFFGELQFE